MLGLSTLIKSIYFILENRKRGKQSVALFTINNKANTDSPENLNGAPQIKNKEHDWLVVHFLHASKNDEEDKIPSNHLEEEHFLI